ncbi:hypothetical protein QBC34DRAFT_425193 [Podospora aff. communis PSN243]|uniref:Uncharacterized protein n=1 Tax=Podospora aff. communis PSN243 TaxID=3040156 RepID=A0AAV9GNL7_9PEZI|nr:hypothetical protein QBC34DRAFT_425193 [Podospora aff. communis PSN243]
MKLLPFICLTLLGWGQASPVPVPDALTTLDTAQVDNISLLPRQSVVSRTIHISATTKIHDDETFGDDEFTRTNSLAPIIVGTTAGHVQHAKFAARAGGEIRVEVTLTVTLNPSDLSVRVSYVIDLYEGTSESTGDLDGRIEGSKTVKKNQTLEFKADRVRNTDEGGDWADVTLTVVNAP